MFFPAQSRWGSKIIIMDDELIYTRTLRAAGQGRLPARVPRGHHADPSHRLLQPATGSLHSLFPTKISAYEARLDADILATLKRVSGRPGRKGAAQVWARRNLEEGKGSRAQGEEEYGITPGSHRHEREHLWRVVPQVNPPWRCDPQLGSLTRDPMGRGGRNHGVVGAVSASVPYMTHKLQ